MKGAEMNLEAALELGRHGVPVFPLYRRDTMEDTKDGRALMPAKRPRYGCDWDAPDVPATDADAIRALWARWPDSLPGIPCGPANIVVIDCDIPDRKKGKDGVALFKAEAAKHGYVLPEPVITPSGGHHYIFRQPDGARLGNTAGHLKAMGCDVRGDGGYIGAAGGVLDDGTYYAGSPDWANLPPCPQWIIDLINKAGDQAAREAALRPPMDLPPITDARLEKWARVAVDGRLSEIASAPKGGSNNTLNECALRIGRVALAAGIPLGSIAGQIEAAAWSNPAIIADGRKQMLDTINSALSAATQKGPADDIPREDRDNVVDLEKARRADYLAEALIAGHQAKAEESPEAETDPDAEPLPGAFFQDFTLQTGRQLIRRWLPANGLIVDGGKSQAGKTYAIVDMCIAIAHGRGEWCGEPVRERVGVIYIAGEGQATLQRRFIAAASHHEAEDIANLPIFVTNWNAVDVLDDAQFRDIGNQIARLEVLMRQRYGVRLGLTVFDTARATANMKDERDNSEVAKVMKRYRMFSDHFDNATLLVHHVGKGDDATLSGAGAWVSNADHCRLFLHDKVKPGDPITGRHIALAKSRIGEIGAKYAFDLRTMNFRPDDYGDPITEAYCEWSKYEPEGERVAGAKKRMSTAQINMLDAIDAANCVEECYAEAIGTWKPSEHEPQIWPGAIPLKYVRAIFHNRWVTEDAAEDMQDAKGDFIPGDIYKLKNRKFDNAVKRLKKEGGWRGELCNRTSYFGPELSIFNQSKAG